MPTVYGRKITGACIVDHKSAVACSGLRSWDLCHSIHHELGRSSRYSFWPKYTHAIISKKFVQVRTGDDKAAFYRNVNKHM